MPSEDRTAIALEAIRPRTELYHSAVATTLEQVSGLLAGTGESPEDQSIALGDFARGHVNVERFSTFTRGSAKIDPSAEQPMRAAQQALNELLRKGNSLFVLKLMEGANLGVQVAKRLATIGTAFSAAHVIELARRGQFSEDRHAFLLDGLAFSDWSQAERALAPGLVIELDGADFIPALVAPYLDAGMKIAFVVDGDAPAAALSRLVTPGVFVQQTSDESGLDAFTAWEGTAVAALLPKGAAAFVHDPEAGETTYERFTTLELPGEIRKRAIGGISVFQQAQDLQLLQTLAVVPSPSGEAASDPAGKLSAWLLSQTSLAGDR
ncbi:MAG: hypothetical protein HKN57_08355 [Xanthomonadales bacterium]|nr:hypothetical protein [Gammaproteobacteria bacterium]NND57251.1 hypothetical protein [Xanthomonadales bacterium]NNK52371.1 hypothetical protein [Xanthomonadales bacterium]